MNKEEALSEEEVIAILTGLIKEQIPCFNDECKKLLKEIKDADCASCKKAAPLKRLKKLIEELEDLNFLL